MNKVDSSHTFGMTFLDKLARGQAEKGHAVPSKKGAVEFLEHLVALLFPIRHGFVFTEDEIEYRWRDLALQLRRLVSPVVEDETRREAVVTGFFDTVPEIWEDLVRDAEMFAECDPAAVCREEVVLCYPGFYAIMVYRFAHQLWAAGVPILPRLLAEHAHSRTGIDIHPGAQIGRSFYIDHGTGIVIGETCVIGDGVKMYQGVTLGATFVRRELRGVKRHPTIENGVILYAGCTILGGETVVGAGSVIGGNVWLTESVPAGSKVFYRG